MPNQNMNFAWLVHACIAAMFIAASALATQPAHAAFSANSLEDGAKVAAKTGDIVRMSVNGDRVTAIAVPVASEHAPCKTVAAWFDDMPRAMTNFSVCGSKATNKGSVAHIPRTAETNRVIVSALRAAVIHGKGSENFGEFQVLASRLGDSGEARCKASLSILSAGYMSSYSVEDVCH